MSDRAKPLEDLVKELPPALQNEARDFVEFLLSKEQNTARGDPALRWAGALKDLGSRYTSVGLRHLVALGRPDREWSTG